MSRSGNVDVLQWNGKWFFFQHVQFDSWYIVMTTNEFSCDRPEVIFRFLIITSWVFLKMGWCIPFIWISLKNFLFFASFRTVSGSRWMFSDAVLTQRFLTLPFATGKMKFPLLCGVYTSLALSFLAWSSDASISSDSSMSATTKSPFQIPPRKMHSREIYLARVLSRTDAVWIGVLQKQGDIRPLLHSVSLVR